MPVKVLYQRELVVLTKFIIGDFAGQIQGSCAAFFDGHLLLQISADNGVFGQTGPKVGSFDAGYGSSHMARLVGAALPTLQYESAVVIE